MPYNYQVNYGYHPRNGLLCAVTGITDDAEYADIIGYNPTGKIGNIYHDNGTQTTYTYDDKSTRLLKIKTSDPNMDDLQEKAYKYTKAGNIFKITDTTGAQNITYTYAYDKLHRLISESSPDVPVDFGAATLVNTFNNSAPIHAPKSVVMNGTPYTYVYDANGNMTTGWDFSDPTQVAWRTIAYNADNMPKTIVHAYSGTTSLKYDGDGTRVKKVSGGSTTYYIGDNFEVADGQEIKYIFAGNLRIAKVTGSGKHFYHKDHLGSSTVMTDVTGSMDETSEYLPFGLSRKHSGSEVTYYKFTDQELDAETGLYNYNARLYDPAAGIFISPDSIVPDWYDPQILNRYAYARNNPLKYIDPSGHERADPFDIDAGGPGAWGSPPAIECPMGIPELISFVGFAVAGRPLEAIASPLIINVTRTLEQRTKNWMLKQQQKQKAEENVSPSEESDFAYTGNSSEDLDYGGGEDSDHDSGEEDSSNDNINSNNSKESSEDPD